MSRVGPAVVVLSVALTGSDVHVPRAQESPEGGLLKLNRALLESQILRRDASLFEEGRGCKGSAWRSDRPSDHLIE